MFMFTYYLWLSAPFIGGLLALIIASRRQSGIAAFFVGLILTWILGAGLTVAAAALHCICMTPGQHECSLYLVIYGLWQAIGIPIGGFVIGLASAVAVTSLRVE